jgi:hypothetical protein
MTSNPNIDDVVNAAISEGLGGSRKSSALSPERSYSKNGTGLQRGSIAEEGKGDYYYFLAHDHVGRHIILRDLLTQILTYKKTCFRYPRACRIRKYQYQIGYGAPSTNFFQNVIYNS